MLAKPPGSRRSRALKIRDQIDRLNEELEKLLKADAGLARELRTPRRSPLDEVQKIVAATADLRESNGNLSARRIAELFGISLNQLAGWLRRSRQMLTKTPDADSLQPALAYFERVARLRSVVGDDDAFRKWLRMSHPNVAARNPLELLALGKWQALADFVDDILSGTPG
jgi:hypothetical protein